MISSQCQCGSWLPIFSAAIFRPAGYKAVVTGAPANPSALGNFADSCCCAVQFSQLFFFLLNVAKHFLLKTVKKQCVQISIRHCSGMYATCMCVCVSLCVVFKSASNV